jgi:hypothetical protein
MAEANQPYHKRFPASYALGSGALMTALRFYARKEVEERLRSQGIRVQYTSSSA